MNWKSRILVPPLAFALAAGAGWLSSPVANRHDGRAGESAVRSHNRAPLGTAERQAATLRTLERELRFGQVPSKHYDAKGMEEAIAASSYRFTGLVACGESSLEFNYGYRWARAAPEAMFAWLSAEGSSSAGQHSSMLFSCWAESDLSAAAAAALTLTKPELRKEALLAVVEVMIVSDPARARAVFEENLDTLVGDGDASWFIPDNNVSQKVLEMLLSLPPSRNRSKFVANLLSSSTIGGDSGALEAAQAVWNQSLQSFREELVAAGFVSDPRHVTSFAGLEEIARRRAESTGTPGDVDAFLGSHGPAWAQRDLDGALAWTAAHVNGRQRFDQSAKLLAAAALQDYPATLKAWKSLPEGYLKHAAAVEITRAVPAEVNDPEVLRERDR